MAPTVTFLLGFAGSGKSHVARQLERDEGAKPFEGIAAADKKHLWVEMLAHLQAGGNCTVEEWEFRTAENRLVVINELKRCIPGVNIRWICFERDIESANWNVSVRPDAGKEDVLGHLQINDIMESTYTIPDGAEVRKIHRLPPSNS
jgi:hypothetical protein